MWAALLQPIEAEEVAGHVVGVFVRLVSRHAFRIKKIEVQLVSGIKWVSKCREGLSVNMGSRASTLLRDEELEEIKKETGCKLRGEQWGVNVTLQSGPYTICV